MAASFTLVWFGLVWQLQIKVPTACPLLVSHFLVAIIIYYVVLDVVG